MAALLTIVPSTAVAVVASNVILVDAKSGAAAGVSNGDQLHVRGEVSTTDVVPTSSWSKFTQVFGSGEFSAQRFIRGTPAGQGLIVGEISVHGSLPSQSSYPDVFLQAAHVKASATCPTDVPAGGYILFSGQTPRQSDVAMFFSFPIPLTIEPVVDQRACLYMSVHGWRNSVTLSFAGAEGPGR